MHVALRHWVFAPARRLLDLCLLLLLLPAAPLRAIDSPASLRYSISGFSSGASLTVAQLVAFSDEVEGIGVVGASPYGCNVVPDYMNTCSGWQSNSSAENKTIPWSTFLKTCRDYLGARAAAGLVASRENLRGTPAYLYSGTKDTIVYQNVMRAVDTQLNQLALNVTSVFNVASEHAWIVDSATCSRPGQENASSCCGHKGTVTCPLPPHAARPQRGGCCGQCDAGTDSVAWWTPPVNNCNFDMTGAMLGWIFAGRSNLRRAPVKTINLFSVNQTAHVPQWWNHSKPTGLDSLAWIYAPQACRTGADSADPACPVHVHYHGCGGSFRILSTSYMLESGLASYAEGSGIVLVFPQTTVKGVSGSGCWDWSGVTSAEFDTRQGVQLLTVRSLVAGVPALLAGPAMGSEPAPHGA